MDDELKKHLSKYLEKIESVANSAGEFAQEQLPDVIQQYLSWLFWENMTFLIMNIVLLFIFTYLTKLFYSLLDRDLKGLIFIPCLAFIIPCINIPVCTYNIVKVTVAPKVVLLEKAMDLVQPCKR